MERRIYKHSEDTKRKMKLAHLGKKHTEETRFKLSTIKKGKAQRGGTLGKHWKIKSEERKKEMSRNMIGSKNPKWKGGVSTYERKLWLNNNRRIKKLGNGGFHTLGEWENMKAQYNWICPVCKRKEPEIKLTRDHIIPISKGGSDNIQNIQPLCRNCNSKKYNKDYVKITI